MVAAWSAIDTSQASHNIDSPDDRESAGSEQWLNSIPSRQTTKTVS